MREDKSASLLIQIVGDHEEERLQVREAVDRLTDPRIKIAEAPYSIADQGAVPDVALVIFGDAPAAALSFLQNWHRSIRRPLLVALHSEQTPALIRQTLQAGADELFNFPIAFEDLAVALLKLKERRRAQEHRGRLASVYTVAGIAGGVGVSTIAANLALALRHTMGRRVGILDLDLQSGGIHQVLHLEPAPGTLSMTERLQHLDSLKLEAALSKHSAGIYVLGAPQRIEDSDLVSDVAVGAVLDLMRQLFDVVVVDCGRRINEHAVASWERATEILHVIDQSLWSARRVPRVMQFFATLGLHQTPKLLTNRFERTRSTSTANLEDAAEMSIYATIPDDAAAMTRLQLDNTDLWRIAPASRVARAFEQLARRIESPGESTMQKPRLGAWIRTALGVSA